MKATLFLSTAVIGLSAAMVAPAGVYGVDDTSSGANFTMDEIVITARRREEKLTDVPSAASLISAHALAERGGAVTSMELLADQPSVRFNNLSSSVTSEISMRASSTARATTGDPSVGLFRNGSYVGSGAIGGRNFARLDFLDIGRVEVLRGTQGALYGRNAVGGAINVISAKPEFENSGFVNARYTFETNALQLQGAANVALSEEVAVRVSGDFVEQGKGFFYNPVNDVYFDQNDGHALRGQFRYKNDTVDVTLLAETQDLLTPAIHFQLDIPAGIPGFPGGYTQEQFSYPWSTPPRAKQNIDGYQAMISVDLGGAELSSTTLFRKRNSEYDLDNDGVNADELARAVAEGLISPFVPIDTGGATFVIDNTDTFTQDLHLSGESDDGRMLWLVGGEALILDSEFSVATIRTPSIFNPSGGDIVESRLEFKSYAAYGSLGYDVTEKLNLTGELRFTTDKRTITSRQFDIATGDPSGGDARIIDGEIKSDDLSYNITASYDIGEDTLAYAKVGSSYRAGGFNTRLSDVRAPAPAEVLFDNESSRSYEVGFKGAPTPKTYFAVAGYYTELKDLIAQVDDGCFVGSLECPVAAVSYLTNAGDAKSWGLEAEFNARFDIGKGKGRVALGASHQGGKVTSGGFDDLDLAQVPDFLASINLNLRYPVSDEATVFGNALLTTQFGGKQELTVTSADLEDYQLLNLRAGVEIGNVTITAFANNLFDQVYLVAQAATIKRYSHPQSFGLEFGYRW